MDDQIRTLAEEFAGHGQLRHAVAFGHIQHFATPAWGYTDAQALAGIRRVIAAVEEANRLLAERR